MAFWSTNEHLIASPHLNDPVKDIPSGAGDDEERDPLTGLPLAQGGSPYQQYKTGPLPPTMKEEKELYELYKQRTNPQSPSEEQLTLPIELAGASFEIDPAGHKKVGKTQKIYNKATDKGAGGSEKQWIQKTGPQLPLAHNAPGMGRHEHKGGMGEEGVKYTTPIIEGGGMDRDPKIFSPDWDPNSPKVKVLAQGLPPVMGERDAVIQEADALRKAGKIEEALDLYRHAATLPTPTV